MKKTASLLAGLLSAAIIMPAHAETAIIKTSEGSITCELFTKEAPNTVANFVGLATGTKEFKDPKTGDLVKRPFYNGLTFHRVIPGFMIQGGDPLGNGTGGPGYTFDNENTNASFSKPGVLAMANAGPNTNGSQFFITVAPTPSLKGSYNVFGQVISGQDVADKISNVPTDPQDKPITPVVIESITIQE
ncbi:peptidylprolyl isomerase [Legionella oakridgensis]|uniref:Peptidyl-prolyl cis-trans isomerase n=2 Tax=Legionella oakridgensis TaxID=29423 RepID=W0B8Z0_9GAMM|nr:peptidylprolyl isomerase [Legionella oakridgensis]AHE66310.1 peptidyl-prolyl cis-trans isomerase rotamase - cyclophilin family [Legionella oakridgensis ATCC 33761 = DSM 21215]ETO93943.1 peptidyl-prolyl cis-trans isomerase (rotamase) - cyclophilin family [Legionella oakridgensis RV-2-2007]KTD37247.1 peptidyl-prolyl cis-trans isomerase [Legionella oakridgensis]STY16199.1 peptidyl-prolyl isomerase [Legionella longbeachae]